MNGFGCVTRYDTMATMIGMLGAILAGRPAAIPPAAIILTTAKRSGQIGRPGITTDHTRGFA
jgi:hypothetical protein